MAKLNNAQVAAIAHMSGWTGKDQITTATAIALAESGGNPTAKGGPNKNGTYDYGLFQINDVHNPTAEEKTDPIANGKRAYKIWVDAGHSFKPWSTYNSGSYKDKFVDSQLGYDAILHDTGIEERLKAGDTSSHFGELNSDSPLKKLDAIGGLSATIAKVSLNLGTLIFAITILVLGVIILLRSQVSSTVGLGKVAKVAKKVGG